MGEAVRKKVGDSWREGGGGSHYDGSDPVVVFGCRACQLRTRTDGVENYGPLGAASGRSTTLADPGIDKRAGDRPLCLRDQIQLWRQSRCYHSLM